MAEFDQIFASDPNNPQNVAENGVLSIYAPGTRMLLPLKTVTGDPLSNPLQLNGRGFGPAFTVDGFTEVAWEAVAPGEVFTGTFKSYKGVLEETIAAKTAAQGALAAVPARIQEAVASGNFRGPAGKDGANGLPGPGAVPADQAVGAYAATPGTATRAAMEGAFAPLDGLGRPLDIWDGFTVAGGATGSWDATTYDGWIAGIDATLGSTATKKAIGTAAGGATIYAYTAGPANAPHALLVGGTHGHELASQLAAMRFFEQFAKATHPVMKGLNTRVRITWIPTLSAGAYRLTRENTNGVDINRNWPFFWEYYVDPLKGKAALSETEAQALKNLLDTEKIACVIDCHMLGNTGPYIMHQTPDGSTIGNRRLGYNMISQWDQTYNKNNITFAAVGDGVSLQPTLRNWASHYMRNGKGRQNAASLLIEARSDTAGLTGTNAPREFMRLYCGVIHLFLVEWLTNGQSAPPITPLVWHGMMESEQATTSIRQGGTLIDTTTIGTVMHFEQYFGTNASRVPYIDVPARCPGIFVVEAFALFETDATETATRVVQFGVNILKTPVGGGNITPYTPSFDYVNVPPAGGRDSAVSVRRFAVGADFNGDPSPLYRVQAFVRNLAPGPGVKVRNFKLIVTHYPNTEIDPIPFINLPA